MFLRIICLLILLPLMSFAQKGNITEDFETGVKKGYDVADAVLKTGSWKFDGALIGSTDSNLGNGKSSVRIQGKAGDEKRNGILGMNFDYENLKSIKVTCGLYAADVSRKGILDIFMSTDGGETYSKIDRVEIPARTDYLVSQTITLRLPDSAKARFKFVNSSGYLANGVTARINVDDIVFRFKK